MFSYPSDQKRIWVALQIRDRNQLLQDIKKSKLYELMKNLEEFDFANNSDLVENVIDLLDSFDVVEERITEMLSKSNMKDIKKRESYLQGSVEFEGASNISKLKMQKENIKENIRALIDECGCFSVHWGTAEVVPS